jgi:hypothetical protein
LQKREDRAEKRTRESTAGEKNLATHRNKDAIMNGYIDHNCLASDDWGVHHEEYRLYVSQFMPSESRTLVQGKTVDGDSAHVYIDATSSAPTLIVARYNAAMQLLEHRKNGFLLASAFPAMAEVVDGTLDPIMSVFLIDRGLLDKSVAGGSYRNELQKPVLENLSLPLPFAN